MSKVMLYRHPSVVEGNDVAKGNVKIKGITFDWIIVGDDEVESCKEQGFFKSYKDALGAEDEETTEETASDLDGEDLSFLKAYSVEDLKEAYTVEELKEFAKALGIKRAGNMLEETLVNNILEKLGE